MVAHMLSELSHFKSVRLCTSLSICPLLHNLVDAKHKKFLTSHPNDLDM